MDLGSLNSLDLIAPPSAFGSSISPVLLQVPALDNNFECFFTLSANRNRTEQSLTKKQFQRVAQVFVCWG
jgi:hypothetical protein